MSSEATKRWSDLDIEDWNRITISDTAITAKDIGIEDQDSRLDSGEALSIHEGIEESTAFSRFHEYAYWFWPFHLCKSRDLRLSSTLRTVSYAFFMDYERAVSRAFVCWLLDSGRNSLSAEMDMAYEFRIMGMVSKPADYIFSACILGLPGLVQIRLETKSMVVEAHNVYGDNPLDLACMEANRTELLPDQLSTTNPPRATHVTARGANKGTYQEVVRVLLEKGADPNKNLESLRDPANLEGGNLPIHRGAKFGNRAIVRLLLDYRASVKAKNSSSHIPFEIAVEAGYEDIMKLLLEKDDSRQRDHQYWIKPTQLLRKAVDGGEAGLTGLMNAWPGDQLARHHLDLAL
ncbi:hypothetical protein OEA41_009703 [Lepraria neglecta]|uniref:Ankyrin n=1 Tax=Lepraria neglecta TaxID=209136 RepID=A0AAD9Z3L9_9LECA|nr:hypothetical protein OEA41_009703 [Lepraria neglecta]